MKRAIVLLSILMTPLVQGGPILVGKGAGLSEYSLLFAQAHLPSLLEICFTGCELTSAEDLLLMKLFTSASHPPEALFRPTAMVGHRPFEVSADSQQVFFNQEFLWLDPAKTVAYDIPHATVLWTEVLSFGQRSPGLAALQSKLLSALQNKVQVWPLSDDAAYAFSAIVWKRESGSDGLYLKDPALATVNATELLVAGLPCAEPVSELRIHSIRWTAREEVIPGEIRLRLEFTQSWSCQGVVQRGRAKLVVKGRRQGDEAFAIDRTSIRVFVEGE